MQPRWRSCSPACLPQWRERVSAPTSCWQASASSSAATSHSAYAATARRCGARGPGSRPLSTTTIGSTRTIFVLRRGLLICGLVALGAAAPARAAKIEVVVTLKQPPLAQLVSRERTLAYSSFARPHRLLLTTPAGRADLPRLPPGQSAVPTRVRAAIPGARVRWTYSVVLNGFAVVVPSADVTRLANVPGVAQVWPSVTYHELLDRTPQLIGAPTVWGPTLATAGQGMKIGIIDDGIDPSRDLVDAAVDAAAKAGVVTAISAGNDFSEFGVGSINSPANATGGITAGAAPRRPPRSAGRAPSPLSPP